MGITGGAEAAPMAPDWTEVCKPVGNDVMDADQLAQHPELNCCTLPELLPRPVRYKELREYLHAVEAAAGYAAGAAGAGAPGGR